ncbi:MAG: pyridoxamine 5'-phosphate oxidase family protein [Sedimenticola sp.]
MKQLRRTDRSIDPEEAEELLHACQYGVMSTVGDDGQPYGVPLSYAYHDGNIYFHCAKIGHKLDNITHNSRVSFTVVGDTKVLPEKFATEYESVVVFGSASEIEGEERHMALVKLLEKYSTGFMAEGLEYIQLKDKATKVIKISIDHKSGKARR